MDILGKLLDDLNETEVMYAVHNYLDTKIKTRALAEDFIDHIVGYYALKDVSIYETVCKLNKLKLYKWHSERETAPSRHFMIKYFYSVVEKRIDTQLNKFFVNSSISHAAYLKERILCIALKISTNNKTSFDLYEKMPLWAIKQELNIKNGRFDFSI